MKNEIIGFVKEYILFDKSITLNYRAKWCKIFDHGHCSDLKTATEEMNQLG